ncbi:MAG: DUF3526 domain-containing protein [Myxococcota bacterium]
MKASTVAKLERRVLLSRSTTATLLAVSLAMSLYALDRGFKLRSDIASAQAHFLEEESTKRAEYIDRLRAAETSTAAAAKDKWAGLAMSYASPAVLPVGPLAEFSGGASDVSPSTTRVSQWSTVDQLFGNYQFQSPAALAAGPFDWAFVVIFMLPLLMIALSFDAISSDKESGRLSLLLSYPVALRDVVTSRLRVRLGAVFFIYALISTLGLVMGLDSGEVGARLVRFLAWSGVGLLYLLWWSALLAWVVSRNRGSQTTVLAMTALWAVLCLVMPSLTGGIAEALYPSPSRLDFLSEVRSEEGRAYLAQEELVKELSHGHAELSPEDYSLPAYIRTAFVVSRTVDRKVQPILQKFDDAYSARRDFLGIVQYASPAVVALHAFNDAAGTGLARFKTFEAEARAYKSTLAGRLEKRILAGERLTLKEVEAMPDFQFQEPSFTKIVGQAMWPGLYLLVLAGAFARRADQNLRRLQTRIGEAQD